MPFRAELYAVVPEDLTRMVACYRPMGFLDHPIDPARARAWLAACAPLLERLGGQASADLLARAKELREHSHSWEFVPGQPAPGDFIFVWRSAAEVRAFFEPKGWFRKRVEDPLRPPTPEQVVAINRSRNFYVSDTTGLEDARRAIDATREDWATEVELLRTAARFGGAFLGVCKDVTDYE